MTPEDPQIERHRTVDFACFNMMIPVDAGRLFRAINGVPLDLHMRSTKHKGMRDLVSIIGSLLASLIMVLAMGVAAAIFLCGGAVIGVFATMYLTGNEALSMGMGLVVSIVWWAALGLVMKRRRNTEG